MASELPLSRSYVGGGRLPATAGRRRRPPVLARRSLLGLSAFTLLLLFSLLDLNTVAYQVFGILQFFSYFLLALCIVLLLNYRFTVYRDLGPSGRIYLFFLVAFLAIGTPIGLRADPEGLYGRWLEIRYLLPSALIVMAAALGARSILLAYGLKFTIRLICTVAVAVPIAIWVFSYFPEFYRVAVGQARDFNRATGTFANPNEAGVAACMVAAAFYSFMMVERTKIVSIIGIGLCAFAVLLTASRAAFMIFAFLTIAQIVISPGFKKIILLLAGGAALAGVVYGVYNIAAGHSEANRSLAQRMEAMLRVARGEITDETTGGRLELAMNGIREWSKSWLLGNGLGTQARFGAIVGPHNTYIRIGGEAGVIPLILFVVLIASLFWRGWNCRVPAVRTLVMGYAIVFAVSCLASHGILVSREQNVMLGICFGLLAGCIELESAAAAAQRRAIRAGKPILPPAPHPAMLPS